MNNNKLPNSPAIEAKVLGAMLVDNEAVITAIELLSSQAFYLEKHQAIYNAMVTLFDKSDPIDIITVYNELKKRDELDKIGGAVYLSQLSNDATSTGNISFHSKILIEKQISRELINNSQFIIKKAEADSEDVFDLLGEVEKNIFDITGQHLKKSFIGIDKAMKDAVDYIDKIHSNTDKSKYAVSSGFYDLDAILGGFQKSDLIILASRPSIGKTALALTLARNAALNFKTPVGIFSLEMSTLQLSIRLLCMEGKINAHQVRSGTLPNKFGHNIVSSSAKFINSHNIFLDDSPSQTILTIRAKAKRLKLEKNIGIIFIDYLQLIRGCGEENREREVANISRSLKALAKELDIPIVALAQLNRGVELRADKRPQLADLRESGSLEQDADVVIFLHRPEFYGIMKLADGTSTSGLAEIIIAKHRNGATGEIELAFIKDFAKFDNLSRFGGFIGNDVI